MSFLFRPVVHGQDSSLYVWKIIERKLALFFFFLIFQLNETQPICGSGFSVGCPWI